MSETVVIQDSDTEYEDYVVEKVELDRDARPMQWVCTLQHGFKLALERRPGAQPKPNDDVRVYGLMPDDVRGVSINGRVVFYHSPEAWAARLADREAERMAGLIELRRTFDADYQAMREYLTQPHLDRVARLCEGAESAEAVEARELMVAAQAHFIAELVRSGGGTPVDIDTLRSFPTFRKLTEVVQYMVEDRKTEGELLPSHTRTSLRATLDLAALELEHDEEGVRQYPAIGETAKDRLLEMTDCPFPERLRM